MMEVCFGPGPDMCCSLEVGQKIFGVEGKGGEGQCKRG